MSNTTYELIQGAVRKRQTKPRRSHNEMMLDVLRVCFAEPTTILAVMLRANVSWKQTMKFSSLLMSKGLLTQSRIGRSRIFHVTNEGKEAVFMWNKLRKALE